MESQETLEELWYSDNLIIDSVETEASNVCKRSIWQPICI